MGHETHPLIIRETHGNQDLCHVEPGPWMVLLWLKEIWTNEFHSFPNSRWLQEVQEGCRALVESLLWNWQSVLVYLFFLWGLPWTSSFGHIWPLHPPLIIQGRVTFESDNDDLTTESDSEDEYMDEYSYDSPSSDSGGPVDKELNPFRVAKRQLSLGLFSYVLISCFPVFSSHQIGNLSTALFSHSFMQ